MAIPIEYDSHRPRGESVEELVCGPGVHRSPASRGPDALRVVREVLAEGLLDAFRTAAAPLQQPDQLVGLVDTPQADEERVGVVALASRADVGLPTPGDLLGEVGPVRVQVVDGADGTVGPDADMVLAADLDYPSRNRRSSMLPKRLTKAPSTSLLVVGRRAESGHQPAVERAAGPEILCGPRLDARRREDMPAWLRRAR
ncbi:hypothetical protein [Streptomyces phaeochromogenes]|uniref:hypothetical protein n=1 Tax=Streptomyces phaeochromogenes TaxID=1923 RepID=UPI003F4D5F28